MQDEPDYVSAWEPKTALADAREHADVIKNIAVKRFSSDALEAEQATPTPSLRTR